MEQAHYFSYSGAQSKTIANPKTDWATKQVQGQPEQQSETPFLNK